MLYYILTFIVGFIVGVSCVLLYAVFLFKRKNSKNSKTLKISKNKNNYMRGIKK